MARLSPKHKTGTGNSKHANERKLEDSNNPDGRNPQKKRAPAASSAEEAATEAFSPGSEAVGTQSASPPSATDKPVAGRSSRSSKNSHSRLSDKKGEASAPSIAKSIQNNANFIQFVLSSEEKHHEIAEKLSVKGFENLNDKMSSTMPQICACMVGEKNLVEVELLGTSIQQQQGRSAEPNEVASAVAAPAAVDNPKSLRFNSRQVNFELISELKLDHESFNLNKHSCGRNADAVRQAQSRARNKIAEAVKLAGCAKEQQALALHLALLHADIQEMAESAGFKNETSKAVACQKEQMKEIMQDATKNEGTLNSRQEGFPNAVFAVAAPDAHETLMDGGLVPDPGAPSMRGCAVKKRTALKAGTNSGPWATMVQKQKGKLKTSPEAVEAACEHIVHHQNVIHSPIANDSLLIKLPGMAGKSRVGKLLLETPVRELHNQMVAEDGLKEAQNGAGQVLISDTTLRKTINERLPQLRCLTARHKQMRGCETCSTMSSNHKSLIGFCQRFLRELKIKAECQDQAAACRTRAQFEHQSHRHCFLDLSNYKSNVRHPKPRHGVLMWQVAVGIGIA
jgi:hypothetical protein